MRKTFILIQFYVFDSGIYHFNNALEDDYRQAP